jgi:lysophospholipase L1-like esterase
MKKFIAILIGCIVAFILCELILRLYNPFQSRIRGQEIILKSHLKKTIQIQPAIKGLSETIRYSTNDLGFRGPSKPKQWDANTSIITVGGSTTECSLLDDDSTWPEQLYKLMHSKQSNIWINNAGIDGCSTFGHLILMRDYIVKLKPNYVLFMVGINDLAKQDFVQEDGFLLNRNESFVRSLIKRSEFLTTLSNVYEALKSHKANVAHGSSPYDYKKNDFNLMDSLSRANNDIKMQKWLQAYQQRLIALIQICKSNQIQPVFITQAKFDDTNAYSWKVMQAYNETLKTTCANEQIPCIDLANQLPKKIEYFYDQIHFSNAGARQVANILYPQLSQIIK